MGVDEATNITAAERRTVLELLDRYLPGTPAWAYGSRVKWTSRPQSDLDIVVFATPEQRRQVGHLREAFEDSNLAFRVDLFVWDDVPETFRKQIEAEHAALVAGARQPLAEPCPRRTDEWLDTTINAIAASSPNSVVGGPFGSNLVSRDYVPQGVPVIRGQNMGARWVTGDFVFVTQEKADSLKANLAQPDDIVLTQRGTLGQVSIVPSALPCCLLSQSQMKVTVDREIADPLFFYYVLSSGEQQDYVRQNAIQTGVPHTNLGIFRSTPVSVPPLKEQRAIAHILGKLDDKIELNRRMNATLEAMARALFKSWFVDFDPVRAKIQSRDTGLPKDIADLFPDRMVNSELGEIPVGWEVKPLRDLLDLAYGNALKADSRRHDGNVPVYGSNGQVGWHDRALVQGPGIVVGRKGNPGIVTWVATDFFPIDTTFYVVPKGNNYNWHFLFFALTGQDLPAIAADSAVPGLNRNLAYMNKQVIPAGQVVGHFNRYVGPIFTRSNQLDVESLVLALLRDTLLPRLTSGDLRVRDAETFLQQAS